jgi:hypothetical protein
MSSRPTASALSSALAAAAPTRRSANAMSRLITRASYASASRPAAGTVRLGHPMPEFDRLPWEIERSLSGEAFRRRRRLVLPLLTTDAEG